MSSSTNNSIPILGQNHQSLTTSTINSDETPKERLAQENLRLNVKLKELEKQLIREKSFKVPSNHHDTSSSFELPSEFKGKWDIMVQEKLMDAFGDFFDRI